VSLRIATKVIPLLIVAGCVSTAIDTPLGPYVNLVDSRGELPPFSVRLPRDMTVSRGFASARAQRPGLVIDVRSLLESTALTCGALAGCLQKSFTIDGKVASSIRYRSGDAYPIRLTVAVPFRDKSIVAEARCATEQQCAVAEQILRSGVFAQIALPS
jgi:hypothetical protein